MFQVHVPSSVERAFNEGYAAGVAEHTVWRRFVAWITRGNR